MATSTDRPRPMNIYVRRGSHAEDKYRALGGVPDLEPEQIAPGVPRTPRHDLLYHGGKTIQNLTFTNFYVGGNVWQASDIKNIDRALAGAMSEPKLNNVMAQYFSASPTTTFKPSQTLPGPAPTQMSQGDVEQLVSQLARQGIPVFDAPGKNVVATFYHELNEARTDPDVEQVIQGGKSSLLGWTSRQGEECGDFPGFEANP